MKSCELLKKAKSRFETEFGTTHEKYGYPFTFTWRNCVLFTKGKKEALTYIKSQHISSISYIVLAISILSMLGCFVLDIDNQTIFILGMIEIFILSLFFYFYKKYANKCKDKVIIYTQD